jgi:coenzyme F420-reducing hydrogenase gamma subunit
LVVIGCRGKVPALVNQVEIRDFLEATSASAGAPYDISLVEGSISTPEEVEKIARVREDSRMLVTIGACATAADRWN